MAQSEILLPKMGESVAEATIIKWLKNEGDPIEADEPIVEIATDKVDSEVPAAEDGVLIKQLVAEGDVIQVGQPIAVVSGEGGPAAGVVEVAAPAISAPVPASSSTSNGHASAAPVVEFAGNSAATPRNGAHGKFYSPLVRNIAQAEGITVAQLDSIAGTGTSGRVTKKDILNYLGTRGSAPSVSVAPTVSTAVSAPVKAKAPAPDIVPDQGDEIIEMDRMRKLIADHMVMSVQTSPHVTSYVEADVTNIVNWRNKNKAAFQEREGEKLTYTPIFMEAIVQAIKEMPMVNVQVSGSSIIKKKNINLGMATALPSGNLIVPVIKNADRLNLVGLAASVNDLAARARQNKLSPDEIGNGTYTVTNVGTFGNVMGTPIINQPQVAIMAVGAIRKKPAVIETNEGDFIGVRQMMFLSHSYDHRVVDGALGGQFVRRVADILEAWDISRTI